MVLQLQLISVSIGLRLNRFSYDDWLGMNMSGTTVYPLLPYHYTHTTGNVGLSIHASIISFGEIVPSNNILLTLVLFINNHEIRHSRKFFQKMNPTSTV